MWEGTGVVGLAKDDMSVQSRLRPGHIPPVLVRWVTPGTMRRSQGPDGGRVVTSDTRTQVSRPQVGTSRCTERVVRGVVDRVLSSSICKRFT